ncbi:unnamed protein product [Darwinula stevensoni]|uniref:Membrane-bound transcription factor site-2 protease n=1 Tax=Darwinula stevensoni TaxID=69355 RepID=A0A7R8XF53_9CRUS|nr:unnamed protein product [Darwinula stevensoni]CAG0895929.1 unnamed protein product [Darwinula stevensoni]
MTGDDMWHIGDLKTQSGSSWTSRNNINIHAFGISWQTTKFQGFFEALTNEVNTRRFLLHWFRLGTLLTAFLIPCALYFLLSTLYYHIKSHEDHAGGLIFEPVIPGVTAPWHSVIYFAPILLLGSFVHELGHALAASVEGISVEKVGIVTILFLPATWVQLSPLHMQSLYPWKRLRILCAGVLHNVALSFVALLFYLTLPHVMLPFYSSHEVATVVHIKEGSVLSGEKGLQPGDILLGVNNCTLTPDALKFQACLELPMGQHIISLYIQFSFNREKKLWETFDCTISDDVVIHEGDWLKCCRKEVYHTHLCFEYKPKKEQMVLETVPYACLPIRKVVASSSGFCSDSSDCSEGSFCFHSAENDSLFVLWMNQSHSWNVLFLGSKDGLLSSFTIRWEQIYIPLYSVIPSAIPDVLGKVFYYVCSISCALALLNAFPCFWFDGQHILSTACDIVFSGIHLEKRLRISRAITVGATAFLILSLVSTLIS